MANDFAAEKGIQPLLDASRSENLLVRLIVEAIQDPFFILGPGGAILFSNSKGMDLTGCSREQMQRFQFSDLVVSADRTRIARTLERMDPEQEVQFRIDLTGRSGEEIAVEFIGVIQGGICFVTVRDLRERNAAEQEWERRKQEFLEKAQERDQYSRELQVMKDLYKEKLREIKEMKEKVELLSYTDALTGICNRRFFIHLLTLEVERQKRYPYPLSLLMIDIDYFKHYNDTNGHLGGDQVLKAISILIEKAVRQTDIVARYGGEEFTAVLINAAKEDALDIAERVRRNVADVRFPNEQAQPNGRLTVSIGVATYVPAMGTPDAFVREADNALYRAKRAGRNRVEV